MGALAGVCAIAASATACGSPMHRVAASPVGLVAASTPWAGVFESVDLPAPVNALTAVSCPNSRNCWATGTTAGSAGAPNGAALVASRNGGASWTAQPIPPTTGYLSSVSCWTATHCLAVGETNGTMQGMVLSTTDGGRSWIAAPPIAGTTGLTAVTCTPSGRCLAVGSGATGAVAVAPAEPGSPWQVVGSLPPGTSGGTAISCADDQHCWATGAVSLNLANAAGSVDYTGDFGAQWQAVPVPAGTGMLEGISCRPMAGSGGALPTTASASTGPTPPTTAPSTAPSTVPTTVPGAPGFECTAVGTTATAVNSTRTGHGVVLTTPNGGSSWTGERVPSTAASFAGISCPTAGACAVVGTTVTAAPQSGLLLLNGKGSGQWRHATTVLLPQAVSAVSCPAVGHCVMAGEALAARLGTS